MKEMYFSIDVETDGPCPGISSMLSLGCAALVGDEIVGKFSANLAQIEGAAPNAATAAWWLDQPEAWKAATENQRPAGDVMGEFAAWVEATSHGAGLKPVCVAYPAGFDFTFVYWYLMRYNGSSPFGFSCLDMKTYAACILGQPFRFTSKKQMPQEWFKGLPPHTHLAIDDAVEQALMFANMRKWSAKKSTSA